jgi:flavin-binding protein dodecin
MTTIKPKDYTGYSELSIDAAIVDALAKAGKNQHVEVIETRSSQKGADSNQYHVTLTTQNSVDRS